MEAWLVSNSQTIGFFLFFGMIMFVTGHLVAQWRWRK